MDPFYEMERARRGRRLLTVAAVISLAAFATMAFAPASLGRVISGWSVFGEPSSDDDRLVEGQVAAVVVSQDQASTQLQVAASGGIETFEVFGGKNPFQRPLSLPSPGGGSTTVPSSGGGEATPSTTTAPSSGGGGSTSTTTTVPAAPSQDQTEPVRGSTVAMLDIFDDAGGTRSQVRVNSTAYLVREGQVFAGVFKVVSLDLGTGCGEFLFGDTPFDLCKGQEILK
jgi:hypothetical protein